MLQKKGRRLPVWKGVLGGREVYAQTIAELLRKEHGDSHRAVKQLMRQTDASERTVKHWLSGQHGPDTVYFLRLVVSSPVIRAFVLGLKARHRGGRLIRWTATPWRLERTPMPPVKRLSAHQIGEIGKVTLKMTLIVTQ